MGNPPQWDGNRATLSPGAPAELRTLRRRLGLSQQQLAARLQVSKLTVLRWENGRTQPSAEHWKQLLELDTRPASATPAAGASEPAGVIPDTEHVRHSVPLSSFIGREQELKQVSGLLARTRLLTLTGAGGSGKTRLALATAEAVQSEYADGVRTVELDGLSDPGLVPQAVLSAIGVTGEPGRPALERLSSALRQRQMLVVVDNCEHLLTACAELAETLLRECAGVRILATSREPLNLDAETVWPVPPLSLPAKLPREAADLEATRASDAAQLFVARAQARDPAFALDEMSAASIAEICAHLDGLPLAIEMAAARVPVLTPHEIAERLGDRFRLLTSGRRSASPRQQTLRATLDWSHALLAKEEQRLLARLSVFPGSFSAAAAIETGGDDGGKGTGDQGGHAGPALPASPGGADLRVRQTLLDLLGCLVEKSLVVAEARGQQTRYRLLETVREYARERLEERGEAETIAGRHAEYFLGLIQMAKPELNAGSRQTEWLDRLELEMDNLRAALAWALAQPDAEPAAAAMISLHRFWIIHSHYREGRTWIGRALARSDLAGLVRGRLLITRGELARLQGDYSAAAEELRGAVALLERESDRRSYASALGTLSLVLHESGDPGAEQTVEEALTLFRELEDEWNVAALLNTRAWRAMVRGDYAEAEQLFAEAAGIFRRLGNRHGLGLVLLNQGLNALGLGNTGLAIVREREAIAIASAVGDRNTVWRARYTLASYVERRAGNLATARAGLEEVLRLAVEQDIRVGVGRALTGFAMLALDCGDYARAARLWGSADAVLLELGDPPRPLYVREWDDEARAHVRGVLGETAYRAAHAEGVAAPLDAVIAELLAEQSPSEPAPVGDSAAHASRLTPHASRLTDREREVLALLATGCSTGEMARQLVLSPRTVERHLANLYAKIGARGRADAIAYALRGRREA